MFDISRRKNDEFSEELTNPKNRRKTSTNSQKKKKKLEDEAKEKKKIIAILLLSLIIIVSIIVFAYILDFFKDFSLGTIECEYYNPGTEIEILSPYFNIYNDMGIVIKINNDKEYRNENPKIKAKGNITAVIKIFESKFNMTNMFKSTYIKKVKMISTKDSSISNLASSFENCTHLNSFEIIGFNTKKVANMSKMFYNSINLSKINITSMNTTKLKDMSYMFKNTNLDIIHIENFNIDIILKSNNVFDNKTHVFVNGDTEKIHKLKNKYDINITNNTDI